MNIISKYFPDLTQKQVDQYAALKDLYAAWNDKINVISRKDMDNFYEHHVLHSLSISKVFTFTSPYKIMDLGSGGGFPGLPLAIFFPEVKFYLVDSINKKLKVAEDISNALGLTNITVQHARAEEMRNQEFSIIVSRAVAPLKDLCMWSKPLVKSNKIKTEYSTGLICLKGGNLNKEIAVSGYSFRIYRIGEIFEEDFFKEKYILFTKL